MVPICNDDPTVVRNSDEQQRRQFLSCADANPIFLDVRGADPRHPRPESTDAHRPGRLPLRPGAGAGATDWDWAMAVGRAAVRARRVGPPACRARSRSAQSASLAGAWRMHRAAAREGASAPSPGLHDGAPHGPSIPPLHGGRDSLREATAREFVCRDLMPRSGYSSTTGCHAVPAGSRVIGGHKDIHALLRSRSRGTSTGWAVVGEDWQRAATMPRRPRFGQPQHCRFRPGSCGISHV